MSGTVESTVHLCMLRLMPRADKRLRKLIATYAVKFYFAEDKERKAETWETLHCECMRVPVDGVCDMCRQRVYLNNEYIMIDPFAEFVTPSTVRERRNL